MSLQRIVHVSKFYFYIFLFLKYMHALTGQELSFIMSNNTQETLYVENIKTLIKLYKQTKEYTFYKSLKTLLTRFTNPTTKLIFLADPNHTFESELTKKNMKSLLKHCMHFDLIKLTS